MKLISKIKNMSRRTGAVFMAVAMLLAGLAVGMGIFTNAAYAEDENVQIVLKRLIGSAKPYAVTAEDVYVSNDYQANFAANLFHPSEHWVGSDLSSNPGTFYFKDMTPGTLKLKNDKSANNIVVGVPYTINGDLVTLDSPEKNIYIANNKNVNIYFEENFLDVTAAIAYVRNTFVQFASYQNTKGVIADYSDMNRSVIDVSDCSDQICVVNITAAELNSIQNGGLKIYKPQDKIVVINVKDITDDEISIREYSIKEGNNNFVTSSANNSATISDTIIWNFADYDGTVNMNGVCGILVAPDARVDLYVTSSGRVIADRFENISGEMHFVSADVPIETEPDSYPTEAETPTTPEKTVPETTTAPETTAPETTAPETTAPETTAPETTTAPVVTVPETTTAPVATVPETTTAPVATVPETTTVPVIDETTAPATETTEVETTTRPGQVEGDDETSAEEETTLARRRRPEVEADTGDKSNLRVLEVIFAASGVCFAGLGIYGLTRKR
ncbi:MAG: hypothetical protein PUB17_10575 [Lachnospiraceae bacterium]|nr:hypothetical protein [Lachnospiraceae bacterium]